MLQQCGVYMCVLTASVCTVHVLSLGLLDVVDKTGQLKDD